MARDDREHKATAPYTRAFLTVYDVWVIRLSNRFAWRCDAEVLLDLYNRHLGRRHLEVGPGSGWYLANAAGPNPVELTLTDLNPSPLAFTARRVQEAGRAVESVRGSVLEPVPAAAGRGYDSVGVNFVLHCVPGDFAAKGVAFRHLAEVLADDGVLFGSTILGQRPRTLFGRALSEIYCRVGAFNNRDDERGALERALGAAFDEFTVRDVGDVTLFTGRRPRRATSGGRVGVEGEGVVDAVGDEGFVDGVAAQE
ncbi:class I SAM-dependent methyltransferase [Nocardia asteroides]|uniref:class I SAM-dependent methyltransferase n=1 Tax=Nocardia asteroides TaxID=1824 RepID=UPI0033CA9379